MVSGIGATVVVTAVVAGLKVVVETSVEIVVVEDSIVDGERTGVLTEHALRVMAPMQTSAPNLAMHQF